MKANCTKTNENMGYVKPEIGIIEIETEGTLCASAGGEGVYPQDEDF